MKVITKTNELCALNIKSKTFPFELGKVLDTAHTELEYSGKEIYKITYKDDNNYIELKLSWGANYLILDINGKPIEAITEENFENKYAILKEEK